MNKYRLANLCNATIAFAPAIRRIGIVCYVHCNRRDIIFHDLTNGCEVERSVDKVVEETLDVPTNAIDPERLAVCVLKIARGLNKQRITRRRANAMN